MSVRRTAANPLLDGLRIEPTPEPTALVIFGASGDLTRRKLLPADLPVVARAAAAGPLQRHRRRAVADDRRPVPAAIPRQPEGVRRAWRSPTTSRPRWPGTSATSQGEMDDPALYDAARREAEGDALRRTASCSTSPCRRSSTATIVEQLERRRTDDAGDAGWLAPHHRREAVRDRSRQRARAEPAAARAPRRVADLPHRSLPRQGNRPEPAGVPLRQRHVRAGLEPPLHRSRADHRGGNRRRRAARELLRGRGRAARHGAEPPDAGARDDRDGAADRLLRRERARSQARRARVDPAAARRTSARQRRPRAVRRRVGERRRSARLPRGRGRQPRRRPPRPTSRCACSSTAGAGRACRSTSAPASGCRSGRPRSRSSSAGRRCTSSSASVRRPLPRTCSS